MNTMIKKLSSRYLLLILIFTGYTVPLVAIAATPLPNNPVDNNPQGNVVEPEVRIIRENNRVIEEYRIDGRLYMVKVTPDHGYPYYFVDNDGDGSLEYSEYPGHPGMLIPQWRLFSW